MILVGGLPELGGLPALQDRAAFCAQGGLFLVGGLAATGAIEPGIENLPIKGAGWCAAGCFRLQILQRLESPFRDLAAPHGATASLKFGAGFPDHLEIFDPLFSGPFQAALADPAHPLAVAFLAFVAALADVPQPPSDVGFNIGQFLHLAGLILPRLTRAEPLADNAFVFLRAVRLGEPLQFREFTRLSLALPALADEFKLHLTGLWVDLLDDGVAEAGGIHASRLQVQLQLPFFERLLDPRLLGFGLGALDLRDKELRLDQGIQDILGPLAEHTGQAW